MKNHQVILNRLFGTIDSKEKAERIVKQLSVFFMVIGTVNIAMGFIIANQVTIAHYYGAAFIIPAALLHKFKSTILAVVLLFVSLSPIVMAVISLYINSSARYNVIIGILMTYASLRLIHATREYNKLGK